MMRLCNESVSYRYDEVKNEQRFPSADRAGLIVSIK